MNEFIGRRFIGGVILDGLPVFIAAAFNFLQHFAADKLLVYRARHPVVRQGKRKKVFSPVVTRVADLYPRASAYGLGPAQITTFSIPMECAYAQA